MSRSENIKLLQNNKLDDAGNDLKKSHNFANIQTEMKALMTSKNNKNSRKITAKGGDAEQPEPKRQRVRGCTRLSKACEKILRADGDRIANALFARAAEGNVSSAKLLLKIIENEARNIRMRRRQAAERRKQRQKEPQKQQKSSISPVPSAPGPVAPSQ
jgi:hypothetical protein